MISAHKLVRKTQCLKETHMAKGVAREVICEDTGVIYPSLSSAGKAIGRNHKSVWEAIQRRTKCGGSYWNWAPDKPIEFDDDDDDDDDDW
eukprot:g37801.t1